MHNDSPIRSFKDLHAWQRGRELVKETYVMTNELPRSEQFGLTNQLRRAAVSVPSNIAEGYGRQSSSEYLRFLRMARGSLYEVQTQLILVRDLAFASECKITACENLAEEASRILFGLINSIETRRNT